ncbi:MAG: hypothetical protein Q4G04_01805 [bacterium]|nr:hypothetical protein [bacterium]
MDGFLEFLNENFLWILVIGVLIIITIIGFIADKRSKKKSKNNQEKQVATSLDNNGGFALSDQGATPVQSPGSVQMVVGGTQQPVNNVSQPAMEQAPGLQQANLNSNGVVNGVEAKPEVVMPTPIPVNQQPPVATPLSAPNQGVAMGNNMTNSGPAQSVTPTVMPSFGNIPPTASPIPPIVPVMPEPLVNNANNQSELLKPVIPSINEQVSQPQAVVPSVVPVVPTQQPVPPVVPTINNVDTLSFVTPKVETVADSGVGVSPNFVGDTNQVSPSVVPQPQEQAPVANAFDLSGNANTQTAEKVDADIWKL